VTVNAGCALSLDLGTAQTVSVAGGGLVQVFLSGLLTTVSGESSLSKLTTDTATVDGPGHLTVTDTLTAKSTTFRGPAGSLVTLTGIGNVLAPVQGGTPNVYDGKGFTVDAGAVKTISGALELRNGAKIENNGTVQVISNTTIIAGAGSGQVVNKDTWKISAPVFTVQVPFVRAC
jgi:hypothetical protein